MRKQAPKQTRKQRLAYTAERRGLPFVTMGMAVECDGHKGTIAGSNDSGNFDVRFSEGPYKGRTGNCHPNWKMKYFDAEGALLFGSSAA